MRKIVLALLAISLIMSTPAFSLTSLEYQTKLLSLLRSAVSFGYSCAELGLTKEEAIALIEQQYYEEVMQ